MGAPPAPRPVSVTGGTHGIAADCAELRHLAHQFGTAGAETLAATVTLHGYLLDPSLVLSAAVDPIGFADFEAELLLALDGASGLGWASAQCAALDLELRMAAAGYAAADRLDTELGDLVHGRLAAPAALAAGLAALVAGSDPLRAAQAVVARDPQLADVLVSVLGIPALLHTVAGTIPDGTGMALDTGADTGGPAGQAPRGLVDLLRDLDRRDGDARHGEIDVRILTLPGGSRRAVVDITGTKSWDPLPTSDVTSLTTNGRALVGEPTAYEGGVLAAMRAAGVRRGEPVMLVGHSEGGLVAVNAARHALASGEFTITHVVTAGAPVGRTAGTLPSQVRLLALENTQDVVPHLDGAANPDRVNVTTASGRRGDGTVIGDHAVHDAYLPLAADVAAARDPSIRDFLTSAAPYFAATSVDTHTYQIQRRY
jgi:hypothetical protein